MKFLLNFSLVTVLFLSAFISESYANVIDRQSSCLSVYQPSKVLPNGRRIWYLHEPRAIGDSFEPKYIPKGRVVELKEVEVSNQCQTSECYLFATINFINIFNRNQKNNSAPLVSEPYLVAQKFLEHIKETLRLGTESPELVHDLEGGFAYEAFHLTRKVGLVAKESWKPKVPLEKWDMVKIYRVLRKKVPELHDEIARLAKKRGSWDDIEVKNALESAYAQLAAVILEFSGPLPIVFEYTGQNYTPLSFEHRFGIPRLVTFHIHNSGEFAVPENHGKVLRETFTDEGGRYRVHDNVDERMVTSMRNYIDNGLPVIIDLKWLDDGHSMLVVGYEVNEVNQIVRFKVMNSWGKTFATKGSAWYTPEDVIKNTTGTYRIDTPISGQ